MQTASTIDTHKDNPSATENVALPNAISEGTAIQMIPLKRLVASPYNQRQKPRLEATVEAFAVNIAAVGLMQNLVVHPMKVGAKKAQTYGVTAGETRRLALLRNVEKGIIDADFEVPCCIVTEGDAILASASENDLRVPPHPADQFAAYKALADQGRSPEFIGAIFNVSAKTVARHLRLANVSPKLFDMFRADEIELGQMHALAITDDHAAQEQAWFGAKQSWDRAANKLKQVLLTDKMPLRDRIVRFVTVEEYQAAGGVVETDLFAERDASFISDRSLLMRLFDEKMAGVVEMVAAEGWKWVESRTVFSYTERNAFTEVSGVAVPLTAAEQERYDQLSARYDEIEKRLEAHYDAEETEPTGLSEEEVDALESEQNTIASAMQKIDERDGEFTAEQKAICGAIVSLDDDGGIDIKRGLVRSEDRKEARVVMASAGASIPASMQKQPKGPHSEKLLLRLTANRTAAVQSELIKNPHVALATLIHNLALSHLYSQRIFDGSAVMLTKKDHGSRIEAADPTIATLPQYSPLRTAVKAVKEKLPADPNALYGWLLQQSQEALLDLLALCTALTLNGVARTETPDAINAIAGALELNLSTYWQPTCDSYLNHVSKDRIVTIVSEVVSADEGKRLAKMKKGEAAAEAEKMLAGKDWLPEFMAAGEVRLFPYYGNGLDDDEEEESEDASTNAGVEPDLDGGEPNVAQENASTDAAPWPFPKAADFQTTETVEPTMGEQAPIDTRVQLQPAAAWPFPMPKGDTLTSRPRAR